MEYKIDCEKINKFTKNLNTYLRDLNTNTYVMCNKT